MMKLSNLVVKVGVIILPSVLFILPPSPAWARRNQFDVCVKQMINSGVDGEKAGTACADALIPKELSKCVAMIQSRTELDADSALAACYRVRRPIDLAYCVIDINKGLLRNQAKPETADSPESEEAPIIEESNQSMETFSLKWQTQFIPDENDPPLLIALDSCRRSLLPGRYSECVTGLGRRASLSPIAAMNTCLEVQAFPTDIFPAYDSQ